MASIRGAFRGLYLYRRTGPTTGYQHKSIDFTREIQDGSPFRTGQRHFVFPAPSFAIHHSFGDKADRRGIAGVPVGKRCCSKSELLNFQRNRGFGGIVPVEESHARYENESVPMRPMRYVSSSWALSSVTSPWDFWVVRSARIRRPRDRMREDIPHRISRFSSMSAHSHRHSVQNSLPC